MTCIFVKNFRVFVYVLNMCVVHARNKKRLATTVIKMLYHRLGSEFRRRKKYGTKRKIVMVRKMNGVRDKKSDFFFLHASEISEFTRFQLCRVIVHVCFALCLEGFFCAIFVDKTITTLIV